MADVEFSFRVPEEMVDLLEESEGKPIEELLDKHLAEWWFGKTHHEADLVIAGKHQRIPQTPESIDKAKKVREVVYWDQQPVDIKKDLGIDPLTAEEAIDLAKKVKERPRPPMPHGQIGKVSGKEQWFQKLLDDSSEEDRKLSKDAFLRKKIAEAEKSQAFRDYQQDVAAWQEDVERLEAHRKGYRYEKAAFRAAKRHKPGVKRLK